jgi:alpha-L-rhamnosidase
MDGWDDPFKAEPPELRWKAADILPPRVPSVRSEGIPPMRRAQRYSLQTIHRSQDAWIADFGQNLAGWAELTLEEPEGTVVNLRFAETLTPDGRLDPGSAGQAVTHVSQEDRYVCSGTGAERYHPRFTYHGFRYVEVRGLSSAPTAAQISAVAVHSSLPEAGAFRCSHADINALYGLLSKTLTSNYLGVPTDCPTRERGAWTGDTHVMASTMLYCHDTVAFLEKFVDDMIVSMQLNRRGIPGHIVAGRRSRAGKNADWVLAMVLVPWQIYLHTADPYIIDHSFDAMLSTVRTLAAGRRNGLIVTGFGDHWPPDGNIGNPHRPPIPVSSTAYFLHAVDCLRAMAAAVDRSKEIEDIISSTEIIRKGFHALLDEDGSYGTQTANALALAFQLGPDDATETLRHHLLTAFEDGKGRFRTGILGNGPLYQALTQAGAGKRVMDILLRREHPGFLGTMRDGATTLREAIVPNTPDGWGPMCSHNHPMQGAYGAWLYESLGGIAVDPKHPGFEIVRMQPHFDPRLDWVQASHRTPCGRVFSHWRRNDNGMGWDISLPPNVRAEVILPPGRASSVRIANQGRSTSRRPDKAGRIRLDPGFYTLTWRGVQADASSSK